MSVVSGLGAAIDRAEAQSAPTYTPVFLGDVAGVSRLNEKREVAGWSLVVGADRAWVASPARGVVLLPLPTGFLGSMANDLNEAGVVVGAGSPYTATSNWGEAAVWIPDGDGGYAKQRLGMLPGHVWSQATALNDVGDIVGFSSDGTFRLPVQFTSSGVVDLSFTGAFDPKGINDGRVLVDAPGRRLDLDTRVLEDLGLPPGSYRATNGEAINEANQVVGAAILSTSTSCDREAARFTDGVGWEILSPCGSLTSAYDINAGGGVVMQRSLASYVHFEGLGSFETESLIQSPVGHWFLWNSYQLAINDRREIAILGDNPTTGESGLLLLIPDSVCQPDLGFGGPGSVTLSVCGGNLSSGTTADLEITGAAPNQVGFLLAALSRDELSFRDGTLIPIPPLLVLPLRVDVSGEAHRHGGRSTRCRVLPHRGPRVSGRRCKKIPATVRPRRKDPRDGTTGGTAGRRGRRCG